MKLNSIVFVTKLNNMHVLLYFEVLLEQGIDICCNTVIVICWVLATRVETLFRSILSSLLLDSILSLYPAKTERKNLSL